MFSPVNLYGVIYSRIRFSAEMNSVLVLACYLLSDDIFKAFLLLPLHRVDMHVQEYQCVIGVHTCLLHIQGRVGIDNNHCLINP